jgi:uncharacterized protein
MRDAGIRWEGGRFASSIYIHAAQARTRVMLRAELLRILVCPENQSALEPASSDLVARINRAIAARAVKNKSGQTLERPLAGGLVRADRAVLYAIIDEIPMMLVDEGILLDQPGLAGENS